MSVKGKKVLHIDRNDHYGGLVWPFIPSTGSLTKNSESASVNLESVCTAT